MSKPKEKMGYITSIWGVATVGSPIHTSRGHVGGSIFEVCQIRVCFGGLGTIKEVEETPLPNKTKTNKGHK